MNEAASEENDERFTEKVRVIFYASGRSSLTENKFEANINIRGLNIVTYGQAYSNQTDEYVFANRSTTVWLY